MNDIDNQKSNVLKKVKQYINELSPGSCFEIDEVQQLQVLDQGAVEEGIDRKFDQIENQLFDKFNKPGWSVQVVVSEFLGKKDSELLVVLVYDSGSITHFSPI